MALAITVAAGAGLWLGLDSFGATDAALSSRLRDIAVRERVFWLAALASLVFAYTTFEIFFRARDTRLIGVLPIRGRTRYLDLLARSALAHLPLALPVAMYGLSLLRHDATTEGQYALVMTAVVFIVGIPLCSWLHLLAGRSLLSDTSALKRQLAAGVVADEAALLVYAPAVGLLATLAATVAAELALHEGILRGRPGMILPVGAGALAIAAVAIVKGMSLCDKTLHLIMPRFAEVDVPPPFRDDGVRQHVPGEGLASRLPAAARPYFLRDLRQLRRRFRLDRILLWIYGGALLQLNLGGDAPAPLAANLAALALFVAALVGSAFRVRGRELASPWLDRALPHDRRAAAIGRLAADAIYPLWAVALTALCVAIAGGLASAAATLGLGLALCAALLGASHGLSAAAFPDRILAAAAAWRGLVIALLGVVLWQLG